MSDRLARLALAGYRGVGRIAAPLAGLFLRIRARRGKEDLKRRGERYGKAGVARPSGPMVWVHAASVGETLAVLPLIEQITAAGPNVVLTTGTVTSAQLAAKRIGARAIHQFVPIDLVPFVRRFLNHWRPDLAIFVESEIWPVTLDELAVRRIPHVLVNARMSERSYRRWRKAPALIEAMLGRVTLCLAQTVDDGERYRALGAPRVKVTGNLKFDTPPPAAREEDVREFLGRIGTRPVWLAASTHEGEEALVVRAHRSLRNHLPELLTIIAPRHPDRGASVVEMSRRAGLVTAQRSLGEPLDPGVQVYVADTIGELGLFYRSVPVTLIGGSMVAHGGQNPIEAARLDTTVIHGPHVHNFPEIYGAIDSAGGAFTVDNTEALARTVGGLLLKPEAARARCDAARRALREFEGALEATTEAIHPLLHAFAVSVELQEARE